jgi:4-amino-4-deoxy-L-arabinose transferase-like glycosyltransferase
MLTILLPFLLGYGIVVIIGGKKSILETFALAWGIGIGLLGIFMFMLSLLGLSLNLIIIGIPLLLLTIALLLFALIKKIPIIDMKSFKELFLKIFGSRKGLNRWKIVHEKALILLLGSTIFYVFFDALVKPIINYDDLWRQGCIAKIIFVTGKVITEQTLQLAGPHPFLNPLSQAWIYFGIGTWNDALGKIVFALCFVSFLLIFYSNLRKDFSRIHSLLFTYLLTSFPLIIYHAGTAYSDFMQTFYYSAGAIYLFQWMKRKDRSLLYFSAILLGIGNFVKQSGIPLWVIAIFVLFVYIFNEERRGLMTGGIFLLISGIVSAPWLFYQNSFLMRQFSGIGAKIAGIFGKAAVTGMEASVSPTLPYGLPTFSNILYHLGRRVFTYADWQILWFVLLVAILVHWKKIWDTKLKYLLLVIILDAAMVFYAFSDPNTYQFLVDATLVDRLIMYQVPVVLFFIASALETDGFFK